MQKWEYTVVSTPHVSEFEKTLNELGAQGWEAISGANCIGEAMSVDIGVGTVRRASAEPLWVAVMKRQVN